MYYRQHVVVPDSRQQLDDALVPDQPTHETCDHGVRGNAELCASGRCSHTRVEPHFSIHSVTAAVGKHTGLVGRTHAVSDSPYCNSLEL
mgnify:CR=1 FL=1